MFGHSKGGFFSGGHSHNGHHHHHHHHGKADTVIGAIGLLAGAAGEVKRVIDGEPKGPGTYVAASSSSSTSQSTYSTEQQERQRAVQLEREKQRQEKIELERVRKEQRKKVHLSVLTEQAKLQTSFAELERILNELEPLQSSDEVQRTENGLHLIDVLMQATHLECNEKSRLISRAFTKGYNVLYSSLLVGDHWRQIRSNSGAYSFLLGKLFGEVYRANHQWLDLREKQVFQRIVIQSMTSVSDLNEFCAELKNGKYYPGDREFQKAVDDHMINLCMRDFTTLENEAKTRTFVSLKSLIGDNRAQKCIKRYVFETGGHNLVTAIMERRDDDFNAKHKAELLLSLFHSGYEFLFELLMQESYLAKFQADVKAYAELINALYVICCNHKVSWSDCQPRIKFLAIVMSVPGFDMKSMLVSLKPIDAVNLSMQCLKGLTDVDHIIEFYNKMQGLLQENKHFEQALIDIKKIAKVHLLELKLNSDTLPEKNAEQVAKIQTFLSSHRDKLATKSRQTKSFQLFQLADADRDSAINKHNADKSKFKRKLQDEFKGRNTYCSF